MSWLTLFLFAATLVDDQVNDLVQRIRALAERESPAPRQATLTRLEHLLSGHNDPLPTPAASRQSAAQLLYDLEHGGDDPAGYDQLAALVRRDQLSVGTDNPSVRARLALADLAALVATDYDFDLPTLAGPTITLRRHRGKPVVIGFWATWCAPCRAELVLLEKLHREGIQVLTVTDEGAEVVHAFMTAQALSLPVVLDAKREVFHHFNITAMPATRILDSTGRLRVESSATDEPELRRLVERIH